MSTTQSLVITSINYPTRSILEFASRLNHWNIIVVADNKTPTDWKCDGVEFLSLDAQRNLPLQYPTKSPLNAYSRKNIGYLYAMLYGSKVIAETDDDNEPYSNYLSSVFISVQGHSVTSSGWVNIYQLYTPERIWPRGFPLELLNECFCSRPAVGALENVDCAIQQYLADGDPDVDAIYRLTQSKEILFEQGTYILKGGVHCPFNSQNTLWFPIAFPLMYLPSYVSFRMTDIWRSFVAQTCLYAIGGALAFHGPTVYQRRNEHSLLRDFRDEVPGYLANDNLVKALESLSLNRNPLDTPTNMRLCYTKLIEMGVISSDELELLDLWLADVAEITGPNYNGLSK